MPRKPKSQSPPTADPIRVHADQTLPLIPLDQIQPYDRNARLHDEDQILALMTVIRDSGFTSPILLDAEDRLIAGHGRLEAARRLGMPELPYVRVEGLTPDQVRRLRLSDNALAARSSWDLDTLKGELGDVAGIPELFELTGFDLAQAQQMGFVEGLPALQPPPGDPIGDPPESQYTEQFGVVVICSGEAEQKAVYERLAAEGLTLKVVKV